MAGDPGPWTSDPILTAVQVLQRLPRQRPRLPIPHLATSSTTAARTPLKATLLRIVLFRLFSKPSTWRALEEHPRRRSQATPSPTIGSTTVLDDLYARGETIYTNAFILCANKAYGHDRKHRNHLALIRAMRSRQARQACGRCGRPQRHLPSADRLPAPRSLHGLPARDRHQLQRAHRVRRERVHCRRARARSAASASASSIPAAASPRRSSPGWSTTKRKSASGWDSSPQRCTGGRLHAIDCQGLFCETRQIRARRLPRAYAATANASRSTSLHRPSRCRSSTPRNGTSTAGFPARQLRQCSSLCSTDAPIPSKCQHSSRNSSPHEQPANSS